MLKEAGNYVKQQQKEKDDQIDIYMDVMTKVLTTEQQQKLIELVKQRTMPRASPTVSRRGTTTVTPSAGRTGASGRVTTPPTN